MFFFYFRRSLFTREKVEISKYDTRRRRGVQAVISRSICLNLNHDTSLQLPLDVNYKVGLLC
jgi:hypothetical protein